MVINVQNVNHLIVNPTLNNLYVSVLIINIKIKQKKNVNFVTLIKIVLLAKHNNLINASNVTL